LKSCDREKPGAGTNLKVDLPVSVFEVIPADEAVGKHLEKTPNLKKMFFIEVIPVNTGIQTTM